MAWLCFKGSICAALPRQTHFWRTAIQRTSWVSDIKWGAVYAVIFATACAQLAYALLFALEHRLPSYGAVTRGCLVSHTALKIGLPAGARRSDYSPAADICDLPAGACSGDCSPAADICDRQVTPAHHTVAPVLDLLVISPGLPGFVHAYAPPERISALPCRVGAGDLRQVQHGMQLRAHPYVRLPLVLAPVVLNYPSAELPTELLPNSCLSTVELQKHSRCSLDAPMMYIRFVRH